LRRRRGVIGKPRRKVSEEFKGEALAGPGRRAPLAASLRSGRHFRTRQEAPAELFEYIEIWYHRRQGHSALGYLSPAVYEQQQVA
jgi:transposase InsO family protein